MSGAKPLPCKPAGKAVDVGKGNRVGPGPGLGKAPNASSRYKGAVGVATLPASLIFGTLYQFFGALAAFGWGAALALCAVIPLTGVKEQGKPQPQ